MIETYRGVVHPWLCDVMGHLNTRHYVAMFDDASAHFLSAVGLARDSISDDRFGWADVKIVLELQSEVHPGGLVVVQSGVRKLGRTSLTYEQRMLGAVSGLVHAVQEITTVYFDLQGRRSAALPENVRQRFAQHLIGEARVLV